MSITSCNENASTNLTSGDTDSVESTTTTSNENWENNREKMSESWWDGKVEIAVVFPENVEQGESFEIKVITRNLLSEALIKSVPSCCVDKGVIITAIKHKSSNYEITHWHFAGHDDSIATLTIPLGGQIEAIWTFEEELETAPKGVYDVYLDNGEVFRNAIKIK